MTILAVYVCSYLNLNGKINVFLCRISPELYFYHMPAAQLPSRIISNAYLYMCVVTALSFLLAAVFAAADKNPSAAEQTDTERN